MNHPKHPRIALALPQGRLNRWRRDLLADLAARSPNLAVLALPGGRAPGHDLPPAARFLHAAQSLLSSGGADPLAAAGPAADAPPGPAATPLLQADPNAFDLLVWAGYGDPSTGPARDLARRLPLGMLALAPPALDDFSPGFVPGRLLWMRGDAPARLALDTTTCLRGPFIGSFVREHFAKAALLPGRALGRMRAEGETYWAACPQAPPSPGPRKGLAPWLRAGMALVAGVARRAWQDLACRRQWFLAQRPATAGPLAPDFASRPFAPVPLPRNVGQADPFLFVHQGRTWCFLEEIPPHGRGVIAVRERLADGSWSDSRRVLEEPFHLSYPFVFAHEDRIYMIPETGQAGRVGLYRATDFPGGWTLERELLSGVTAVDATLLEHGGRWWMFVTLRPPGGSSWDELHLYSAPGPLGPFTPHPANPVVSDVRRARPAGRVFARDGRLYRPGQDCSRWYGRGLALMEITRLDASGYAEREVARLDARLIAESVCLHTYQACGDVEMVDGQRFTPVWRR